MKQTGNMGVRVLPDHFTKKDWALFRDKIGGWQEAYMDKLNKEYIELLSGDGAPSDKFWELEKRVRQDKKSPGVLIDMRRSQLIYNILGLLKDGVISRDDLEGFSSDLKDAINFFWEPRD